MAERRLAAGPRPADAEPLLDSSAAEHIFIGSEDSAPTPLNARTVREQVEINNPVRRTTTVLTLYEEGFLKVVARRSAQRGEPFSLDLHYLDPVPSISRVIATRALYVALGSGAAAALAWLLAQLEVLRPFAVPALLVAAAATAAALLIAVYRSHERIEFCTIHGRAPVLTLIASLGSIKRCRAFVPLLSRAIDEAAERIGGDTSAYLRAEMREHYRLRGDGVLSREMCAESTGRILAQFDVQI
jgi:hypothetical protein